MQQDDGWAGPVGSVPDPSPIVFDIAFLSGSRQGSGAIRLKLFKIIVVHSILTSCHSVLTRVEPCQSPRCVSVRVGPIQSGKSLLIQYCQEESLSGNQDDDGGLVLVEPRIEV